MQTRIIKPGELDVAATILRAGKLVAFPTDTFFALGAVPEDAPVRRLFDAKGRPDANPVPLLVSSPDQIAQVSDVGLNEAQKRLADKFWPGPLTLVVPASASVPSAVTAGTGTVGVRVPEHELARQLISLVGAPLTGTSANVSGRPPCKNASEVLAQLGGVIDAVIEADCGDHTAPSTVVGFSDNALRVYREGSISESDIRSVAAGA